jgi:hypothetical protein
MALESQGSYVETCSCDLICPCNATFDHGVHPAGSNLTIAEAKRSRINAFGIEYEGKTGLSTSEFSWAA